MAKSYIKLFFDWEESADALTDAEKLNLIRVMIAYASGQEYEFIGNERFVFPAFKTQLDRANGIYETKCRISRENGSKSNGRPRKPMETEKTDIGFSEPKKPTDNQDKEIRLINKTKTEEKDEDKDSKNKNEENPYAVADDSRPKFNSVEAYAENNLAGMTPMNRQELLTFMDDLSEELIIHAIDRACGNGKGYYNYVRVILNGYLDKGIRTVGEAKADEDAFKQQKGGGKQIDTKQAYQQHEYKASDFDYSFYYDPTKDYGEA